MTFKNIHSLISKYWDCKTTVDEEKVLQDFFSQNEIPEDLKPYAPLFQFKSETKQKSISSGFEKKLQLAINKQEKNNKYIIIKIFAPALRIAVTIALFIGLSFGLYFMVIQNRKNYFAETYNDPSAALKHATFALDKLSNALKKGEDASMETMEEFKGLKLNWAALDSLGTKKEQQNHTKKTNETEVL